MSNIHRDPISTLDDLHQVLHQVHDITKLGAQTHRFVGTSAILTAADLQGRQPIPLPFSPTRQIEVTDYVYFTDGIDFRFYRIVASTPTLCTDANIQDVDEAFEGVQQVAFNEKCLEEAEARIDAADIPHGKVWVIDCSTRKPILVNKGKEELTAFEKYVLAFDPVRHRFHWEIRDTEQPLAGSP